MIPVFMRIGRNMIKGVKIIKIKRKERKNGV